MSIQQSINQAISGSLFLLSQSGLYRTLKEERDLKLKKERNRLDSDLNATVTPSTTNAGMAQPTAESQNAGGDDSQYGFVVKKKKKFEGRHPDDFAYSQQIAEFDLQQHLQRKVKEASRTEQLSREYRGQLTGRGDTLG